MTTSLRIRNMLTAKIVIALFSVLFAGTAIAERWYVLWTGTFDAHGAVELESITPAPEYPSAMALWVYVHHGINTFDCSPPVNCLATSQLTYYYVDCGRMQAAVIRRIPMNLRGKVVEIVDSPVPAWFSLVWAHREEEDDGWRTQARKRSIEQRHREIRFFCGLYNAGAVNEALRSYAPLR